MSYIRVLPRDLFNEANLLKCLGALWIALDGFGAGARFETEAVDGFEIQQDEGDGSIFVANVEVTIGGRAVHLSRPLNSRQPWPLYLSIPADPSFEVIRVFDDNGGLSDDLLDLIRIDKEPS